MLAVAMLTAAVLGLSGCVGFDTSSSTDSAEIDVRAGVDADLAIEGALEIELPGEAIEGSGRLRVDRIDTNSSAGWSIEMVDGAALVGTATIRFDAELDEGEPAPIVAVETDGGTLEAVEVEMVDGAAVVRTTHFSNWFMDRWKDIVAWGTDRLDDIYRGTAKQPSCDGTPDVLAAGYTASGLDGGEAVLGCFGLEGGDPVLRLANNRGYTVGFESTPGLEVSNGGLDSLAETFASIIAERPRQAGNTVTLVGPGDSLDFTVTDAAGSPAGVRGRPSPAGYLVTAASYAIDTVGMIASKVDGNVDAKRLATAIDWAGCLQGTSELMTADIATARQANDYLHDALDMALSCAQAAAINEVENLFAKGAITGISWFISGVKAAVTGLAAAADTVMHPDGHTVIIESAWRVPGMPSELAGDWCSELGDPDEDICFEESYFEEVMGPDLAVVSTGPSDRGGELRIDLCTDGGPQCSVAASVYLEYYPAGVGWDCQAYIASHEWGNWDYCSPDYSAEHDLSRPRLVWIMNHQQAPGYYIDRPPMYQVR